MERWGKHEHNNNNNNYGEHNAGGQQPEEPEPRKALLFLKRAIATVGFITVVACVVLLWYFMGVEFGISGLIIALAILIVITGAWRFIWIMIVTTPRDVR